MLSCLAFIAVMMLHLFVLLYKKYHLSTLVNLEMLAVFEIAL